MSFQQRKTITLCTGLLLLGVTAITRATPVLPDLALEFTLSPQDNLYATDWGHAYTQFFDPNDASQLNDPELFGLGAGSPARAVTSSSGDAVNFSSYNSVDVIAEGWIQANNIFWTNPDGDADFIFREQPAYSLIGIWSNSDSTIVPSGETFFIGSDNQLTVPDIDNAYLFLGLNDGWFADNGTIRSDLSTGELENFYQVSLLASTTSPVPLPPTVWLLGSALTALLIRRRFA